MGVVFRSGLTMLIPTLLLSFLCLSLSEPGAPWTEEEAKIVKGKIYAILGSSIKRSEDFLLNHPELKSELNGYVTMVRRDQPEWKWPEWPEAASRPNVPKLIRLGFHQCLKNSDGTGGCNGCLNNHGMGLLNRHNCSKAENLQSSGHRRDLPNSFKTNNAGLELTADMLEEIFTNKDFPENSESLEVSLAESGKSRADLWSFAAAIGVEQGIDRNNLACDGKATADHREWGDCPHYKEGEKDCKIKWPEPLKFYTGRSDCQAGTGPRAYETTREESHPNPVGTGQDTVDFFKKDFGLTARESAALLLGAHSIGEFNFEISQFRYDWTKHQKRIMNNQLFRNIAMKPQYFTECGFGKNFKPYAGDYLGQPAATRWRVVGFECQKDGGPYHWFHQYYRVPTNGPHSDCTRISKRQKKNKRKPALDFPAHIPEIYKDGDEEDDRSLVSLRAEPLTPEACCKDVPRGQKTNFEGCQALIKNGETALGADMGFYFNFTVDPETGKPGGCDGLTFNKMDKTGTVNCGMNHYAPEGEPLYQIVEDFADHQDNWIRDFLVAFDKMSKNGNSDLVDGPTKWFGTTCKPVGKNEKKAIWTCKRNWRGCKPNKDQKDQGPEIWSC